MVIYEINCSGCIENYYDQNGITIEIRCGEHSVHIKYGKSEEDNLMNNDGVQIPFSRLYKLLELPLNIINKCSSSTVKKGGSKLIPHF